MFSEVFERHANSVALRQDDGRFATYAELAALAKRVGLPAAGHRHLVAIFCSNTIDAIVGYVAALVQGHVALLLSGDPGAALNAALLAHFQISRTWAPDAASGQYELRDTGYTAPVMDDALALLLSTSGSTGSKKLVRLSQDNLRSNAESIATYLGIDSREKPITTLPMHYSYGLSIINSHLLRGAEILLTQESIIGRIFWPFAREFGATSFGGVPLTYQLLHRMGLEQMDLPALRYFTQAGGRLDTALVRHFADIAQRTGRRFYVMYGQTEATARIAYLPHDLSAAHPASIGRPIPGGELAIVAEDGAQVIEPGVTGELVYRGPNVMLGYAEHATDLSLPDQLYGVLHTGDIAYRDEQGLYFIAGRKKRFIKINGNRIGLDDVESFLAEQGHRVAAIGRDEKLQLLVEGEPGNAIAQLLWQNLSIHPRNCALLGCTALPRSAAGKVVYPEVEQLFNAV
jgi:acyl-CoA synthetase (AMP-forming)/AMP-acid ligase II